MTTGSRWKCGRCQKVYEFDEWMKLERIPCVPSDVEQYGYTAKCSCGYVFGGEEKFHLVEKIVLGDDFIAGNNVEIIISTVFLEMEHSDEMWYETMVFSSESIVQVGYQRRYKTKDEAKKGHETVVKKLSDGDYQLNISQYDLELEE